MTQKYLIQRNKNIFIIQKNFFLMNFCFNFFVWKKIVHSFVLHLIGLIVKRYKNDLT